MFELKDWQRDLLTVALVFTGTLLTGYMALAAYIIASDPMPW